MVSVLSAENIKGTIRLSLNVINPAFPYAFALATVQEILHEEGPEVFLSLLYPFLLSFFFISDLFIGLICFILSDPPYQYFLKINDM